MPQIHHALTPDALAMIDTIARTGSFAAAARELGKVPSALTYSVRQLEEALDVLLFDRRSRQAKFTAAGEELLNEGRRLLAETAAVANRVRARRLGLGDAAQRGGGRRHLAPDGVRAVRGLLCAGSAGPHRRQPARQRRARHAAEAAHRGAGRHLGGAGQRPGRPGHRRGLCTARRRAWPWSRWARWPSSSRCRRSTRWPRPRSRSTTSNCCATARWRWPTRRSTCRR